MGRKRFYIALFGVLAVGGAIAYSSEAGGPEQDAVSSRKQEARSGLRGLKGVHVTVEDLGPEVERQGLTRLQIQTDVELQLRKAGITVMATEEWVKDPSGPVLWVSLSMIFERYQKGGLGGRCAFNLVVHLEQRVKLIANGEEVFAVTWEESSLGTRDNKEVGEIRDTLKDLADRFINDYLAANPTKTKRP